MSKKLYEEANISAIASAIRSKNGLSSLYSVADMPGAILSISANPVLQSVTLTSNGEYAPSSGVDGFNNVVVSVPASGGILVSKSISINGTYNALLDDNADGYSEVVVSVPAGGSNENFSIAALGISGKIYDASISGTIISYAFYSNNGITEVELPFITNIYKQAFGCCYNLSKISFINCTYAGNTAFGECTNLTDVYLPECLSLNDSAFINCSKLINIDLPKCSIVCSYAFYFCSSLTSVSFPECTTIYTFAFYNCASLTSAYFPKCTSIHTRAFQNCASLTSAYFPKCKNIGGYAFNGCLSFISVSFPACEYIGESAFQNCSSISILSFPEVITLGPLAFHHCENVTEIHFPKISMLSNADVFGRLYNLSIIDLPNLETLTGETVFYMVGTSVSGGIDVVLPKCRVLSRPFNLGNVKMGSFPVCSVIGSAAFSSNNNLSAIYLLSSSVVYLVNSNAFTNTPMINSSYLGYFGSIFVPESLVNAYKSATNWSHYSARITAYIEP